MLGGVRVCCFCFCFFFVPGGSKRSQASFAAVWFFYKFLYETDLILHSKGWAIGGKLGFSPLPRFPQICNQLSLFSFLCFKPYIIYIYFEFLSRTLEVPPVDHLCSLPSTASLIVYSGQVSQTWGGTSEIWQSTHLKWMQRLLAIPKHSFSLSLSFLNNRTPKF